MANYNDDMNMLPNPISQSEFSGLVSPSSPDITIPVSSSVSYVNPNTLSADGFELQDQAIIPSEFFTGSFVPGKNYVEFYVYDSQKNLLTSQYNFKDYNITDNTSTEQLSASYVDPTTGLNVVEEPSTTVPTNQISLNPSLNIYSQGFENGTLFASYNFVNYELGSSPENTFFISEISSDRTEIAIKSNTIPANDVKNGYISLINTINSSRFFDEFYLSFFNNEYAIATNVLLTGSLSVEASASATFNDTILIKLYEPLNTQYQLKDELYVASKVGESQAYKVEFIEDIQSFVEQANFIKGPNVNIELKDLINNSTTLKSYEDLVNTPSSESLNSLLNVLNQTGVTITPNYSYNTFNEFINFSSAKERINNFYEKVSQIESYEADIETLTNTTGSNPNVNAISSSIASLNTNISNLVENFDGYENYLYYNSSSFAYPKTGSSYPYELKPTGSTEVLEWLGNDIEGSQYYGGYVLSASLYDEDNQNWLYYTIPTFITENSDNNNYITFSNMVGQSFDEVWLYTKALSERFNTTNDPDRGLPLDLAAEAIKGLGFSTFGNNYDNQDNFIGLTGEDNGVYVPPTGSELITQYIAVNKGEVYNYWTDGYAWANYVQSITEPGFPYAIDKVSKEIFKRLYHNMAYLTKKKGTISGLRQLINIWGIPNTILRINEFGGKNRDNSNDYDLWYNRFSYAYTPIANSFAASSSVKIPWMPLERNRIADGEYIVPDGLAFRFKTTGFPSSSFGGSYYSQSLAVKKSNGTNDNEFDFGVGLFYEDQPSGSYSGSSNSDYYDYGRLRFYISGSVEDGGVRTSDDIYLPFFNKGWWSILFQRNQHTNDNQQGTTYTLYAANKQYNGADGNVIGWTGSVSITTTSGGGAGGYGVGDYGTELYGGDTSTSSNKAWNDFGVTEWDGVYLGGFISGSNVVTEVLNESGKIFSGSLQEFRYYSHDIPIENFHDFTMNPESIEGNNITGSESSFDIVNFRAPLGNELEPQFTGSYSGSLEKINISSSHPAVTGSANLVITASFVNPANSEVTSSYELIIYENDISRVYSKPNTEVYLLDQPSIGVRNRVSNKIQVEDGDQYGNVLSKQVSIDQNYLISQSYTENINNLEVAFSPQDEVNDDIIATFGYGVVSDAIADPRFVRSQDAYYPELRKIAKDYFKKYTEGNIYDYLRLIKYFDNSLFKAIKSYVPARTSLTTGVLIKQHMLERNRRPPVQITPNTTIAKTPETGSLDGIFNSTNGFNSPIMRRDLELTGSIDIATLEGGTGGTAPNLIGISSSQAGFNIVPVTQSWNGVNHTISGSVPFTDFSQDEFYDGEFSGSTAVASTQEALFNPFATSIGNDSTYHTLITGSTAFKSLTWDFTYFVNANANDALTALDTFNPGVGESALSFFANPGGTYQLMAAYIFPYAKGTGFTDWSNIITPSAANGEQLTKKYPQQQFLWNSSPAGAAGITLNSTAPYFTLPLTSSGGTWDDGDRPVGATPGLDSRYIISSILSAEFGLKENYEFYRGNPNNIIYSNTRIGLFIKRKKGNTYGVGGPGVVLTDGEIHEITVNFGTYYPSQSQFQNTYLNTPGLSPNPSDYLLDIGTASLALYQNTLTGSTPDSGDFYPIGYAFNKNSIDPLGNEINNTNTLANNPIWDIALDYNGTPANPDYSNLSGSTYYQNLSQIIEGPFPDQRLSTNVYWVFGPDSRPMIGDSTFTPIETGTKLYNFTPSLPSINNFYNTAFNPIINNVSGSRTNTYIQIVDYGDGINTPTNLEAIRSGSALKAEVPDSYYTSPRQINPRYNGSTLQSANYNTYTAPSQSIIYLNNLSGSEISGSNQTINGGNPALRNQDSTPIYGGDRSYGSTSVIEKNPIYFAHFKSSKENYELWDTYTFRIDSLIESPLEDITGAGAPQTPNVIKIDGSNDNLTEVRSTFEVDRKALVSYNVGVAAVSGSSPINYTSLKVGNSKIYQGSLEYNAITSTQPDRRYFNFSTTMSFDSASWVDGYTADGGFSYDPFVLLKVSPLPGTQAQTIGYTYWAKAESNQIRLMGGGYTVSGSIGNSPLVSQELPYQILSGPGLGVIHSFNKRLELGLEAIPFRETSVVPSYEHVGRIGIPTGSPKFNSEDPDNYWIWNPSASADHNDTPSLNNYEDFNLPFTIKVGDEIRVSWVQADEKVGQSQDFTVTTVNSASNDNNDYSYPDGSSGGGGIGYTTVNSGSIYDEIGVYPNPLDFDIPNNEIYSFTIRRRVNADDRVIVYQTPPTGSAGIKTLSPSGFLIPGDFTPQQKRNVLTLINQLNAKNSFDLDLANDGSLRT
jgi:hypothetical protein